MSAFNGYSPAESKHCSKHNGFAPNVGGKYISINHGRNRRWICQACCDRYDAKKKGLTTETDATRNSANVNPTGKPHG